MSGYNKVILMGNLTRDPEVKNLNRDNCVLSFSIGINKKYRDSTGELQDRATFPTCVAWNRTARFIERYFRKGDPIHIDGELRTRSYKDNDGKSRYVTEVYVLQATFAGATKSASGSQTSGGFRSGDDCREDDYSDIPDYPGDGHPSFADVPF